MHNEEAIELLNHTIVIDINDERRAQKQEAIRMGVDALKAQKVGKWEIYVISMFDGEGCRCSECGFEGAPYWDFCPNCGVRMEGTDEEK